MCCFFLVVQLNVFSQQRYTVLINEIMADPAPSVSLPSVEWIELRNRGSDPVNLEGWRVADLAGQSGRMPPFVLQPDSLVLISSPAAQPVLSSFGRTIAVTSFPSLDNEGELIWLRSANGETMHALDYRNSWHSNALKRDGGFTLELIDPMNACAGRNNWTSSMHPSGGTPGRANSVKASNADADPPVLIHAIMPDSTGILLIFDETLDSAAASKPELFSLTEPVAAGNGSNQLLPRIVTASATGPMFDRVLLRLDKPADTGQLYQIRMAGVVDCAGNQGLEMQVLTGRPLQPSMGDLVINELLFDPRAGSEDYVEVVNPGRGIYDLSLLHLANRGNTGQLNDMTALSAEQRYLLPGQYAVFTTDSSALQRHYLVRDPLAVRELSHLPSLPDTEGEIVLLDDQGNLLDEVRYDERWHFPLLDDREGVSLERLSPHLSSQQQSSWHSASATSGYGTPGSLNSQRSPMENFTGQLELIPPVISPDNDGQDDALMIRYRMPSPGYTASVRIYSMNGVMLRTLRSRELLGLEGAWQWDGLNERKQALPAGNYIIMTELFDLTGTVIRIKRAIGLMRH